MSKLSGCFDWQMTNKSTILTATDAKPKNVINALTSKCSTKDAIYQKGEWMLRLLRCNACRRKAKLAVIIIGHVIMTYLL